MIELTRTCVGVTSSGLTTEFEMIHEGKVMNMIEVIRTCTGLATPHGFITVFKDPVDWDAVHLALKETNPRCELHPAYDPRNYCDYE